MKLPETLAGPDWARGCPSCEFGIVVAPDILAAFPINESRAMQAAEQLVEFCDCRAGHMYRQNLRKHYNALNMETRRSILEHINAASVPTVHA